MGQAQGSEFLVNLYTTNSQSSPTVAIDADGDFVIAWNSFYGDGSSYGVYARQYTEFGPGDAGPTVTDVRANNVSLPNNSGLPNGPSTITVVFSENLNTTGGAAGANSVTNLANWTLTRGGVNVTAGTISGITFGFNAVTGKFEAVLTFASPLVNGNYVLTALPAIRDTTGNSLDGDANGTPGGNFTRSFSVLQVSSGGSEFRVNSYTTDVQRFASVAMDADGDFVVTWESFGQDGSGYGIYAQRYNALGVAQGNEFRVSTYTSNAQSTPAVAMDADGNFVVTWQSFTQEGTNFGVYAQRYNALGQALGSEFRVNTYTTNVQSDPAVAMDESGDFVVTWTSSTQDGSDTGIYAQRYNALGQALGSEFRVNTYTTNIQASPSVAMDAEGDFVVTWNSLTQDGSGYGVYAQRYDALGQVQGSEFRANTYTTNSQKKSAVAMDAVGDFVVTWHDDNRDNSSYGIYAQRYVLNSTPTASTGLTLTTNEDTPVNGYLLWGIDAETPLNSLIFTISTPPTKGTLVKTGQRSFNFTPAANANGADSFQFTVTDANGAVSAPATVNITINPVNDLPVASTGLTLTTNEDTPVNGYNLWGFDVETPLNSLVFNISTPPTKGTLVKTGQRTFNFTPALNANGADSFQFTVTDSNGVVSPPATVNITINSVNDLPTASTGLTMTTNEDTAVNGYNLWGFDVETPLNSLVFTISTPPTKGTLVKTGQRTFNFTPAANANGADTFRFTVTDSNGVVSAPATVNITINPVNDTPTASGLSLTTTRNTPLNGVLLWAFDVETPLASLVFNVPATSTNGTIVKTGQRSINYTPNNNFTGSDSFQFTVTDGNGVTSAPATVNITVNAPAAPASSRVPSDDPNDLFAYMMADDESDAQPLTSQPAVTTPTIEPSTRRRRGVRGGLT